MKRTPLYLLIPVLALAGCELLVDFDRTKIPSDAADASTIIPGNDGSVEPTDGSTDTDGATDEDAAVTDGGDGGTEVTDGGDAGDSDGSTDDGGSDDAGDDDAGDAG